MSLSDRERAGGFQGGRHYVDGVDTSSSVIGSGDGDNTEPGSKTASWRVRDHRPSSHTVGYCSGRRANENRRVTFITHR